MVDSKFRAENRTETLATRAVHGLAAGLGRALCMLLASQYTRICTAFWADFHFVQDRANFGQTDAPFIFKK